MTWPLPDRAFVPGAMPRPETSPAFDAADAAPTVTDPEHWRENATYLYGATLYEAGFFWEAHEVWEPVWMRAHPNSRERTLLQGLIQLANAALKLRMDRTSAARRLAAAAEQHLRAAGPDRVMGIEPERLANRLQAFAKQLSNVPGHRVAPLVTLNLEG